MNSGYSQYNSKDLILGMLVTTKKKLNQIHSKKKWNGTSSEIGGCAGLASQEEMRDTQRMLDVQQAMWKDGARRSARWN
jgi:hypothetical protein